MKTILGIGNPGKEYESTRHNVGHLLIETLCREYQSLLNAAKGDYLDADIEIDGRSCKLVKSLVFMNNSGIVAWQLSRLPQFSLSEFLVVMDDFSIPLGSLRMRRKGSSGGHRGLESIIYNLNSENFPRMRIGIGPIDGDAVDFVLSRFTNTEINILNESIERAKEAVKIFVKEGIDRAMNFSN